MHKIHIQQGKPVRDDDSTRRKAWNTQSMFKQKFHVLQKEESLKWRISDDFHLKSNFFSLSGPLWKKNGGDKG